MGVVMGCGSEMGVVMGCGSEMGVVKVFIGFKP